jgi:pentatricopeptide repeat protein
MLEKARDVFEQLPVHTVVSWSSLIAGYGQLGQAKMALEAYSRMKSEDIAPNSVTFVILLNSCSHAGLIREGENIFDEMCIFYRLSPTLEHYTCMIDLFGRAGHFEKLQALLLNAIPCPGHYLPFFKNILGSCRKWRNVKLGRWAFEKSMQLDARCGAAYVCMRNIYATAGMQAEADRIEALRAKNKASKIEKCCWWAEADKSMHSFAAACDENHPQTQHIYKKLEEMHRKLLEEGYAADSSRPTYSFRRNETKQMSCGHTEKLAIACALINSPEGMPIHVTKNTAMCRDCHWAVSLLSKIERRRIQVKGAKYVHIFEKGRCICDDSP